MAYDYCHHCCLEVDIYSLCDHEDLPWNVDEEKIFKCPHCRKKITVQAHESISHSIIEEY
jgi:hypothetical protein